MEDNIPLLAKEEHELPLRAVPVGRAGAKRKVSVRTAVICSIVGVCVSVLLHLLAASPRLRPDVQLRACASTEPVPVKAPRHNVWKNLDLEEAVALRAWLMADERGLNLTKADEAADSDNLIHLVEAYKPPKAAALSYLADRTETFPKYAHAIINHGPNETIIDYLVGPLPLSPETTMRPLTEIYHAPVPLNARSTFNWTILGENMARMMQPLDEIVRDLFNGSVLDGTLAAAGEAPMSYDGTWRRSWIQLRRNTAGSWLQALDWYMYVDFTGTDAAEYKWLAIVHNRVVYKTVDEVVAAWKNGTLVRSPPVDGDWATRKIKGQPRDLDDRAGPRTVQFDGPRYRLDDKEDYITWMGWAFYLSFERDMGVHLWDINFRGERIIYELAPQEAMAQYSGDDPHQASTVWLDGAFGMGSNVREVILSYDCPADAILLNATVHEQGSSTRRNAICVFERESGRPLSRHTGWVDGEMGAVKGYELVVRSVSTVGNYDYIFDYTFQLDGTIEIRLSASGYLQGGLWKPEQAPYGHTIGPDAMGSLHDHIINYKVDFDIAGTANSFMSVALEMEDKDEAWFNDDWGPVTRQQRLVRRMVPQETLLNFPQNAEGAYVITNEQAFNTFGNPRGYTIHPGPLCHLTNLDAKRTEHNVNWAKHHLAVSRSKDTEPKSSSMWNMNLPGRPPVNFYNFFDNETISQEDIVVWLNLGTHHIPRAEGKSCPSSTDSPNTLTNVATSYVLLVPWNFNDYDVSLESRNSVLLNSKGQWAVQEAVKSKSCVPEPLDELTYHGVDGYREDGTPVPHDTVQYQEMLVEMNHGLRAWNERAKNL